MEEAPGQAVRVYVGAPPGREALKVLVVDDERHAAGPGGQAVSHVVTRPQHPAHAGQTPSERDKSKEEDEFETEEEIRTNISILHAILVPPGRLYDNVVRL